MDALNGPLKRHILLYWHSQLFHIVSFLIIGLSIKLDGVVVALIPTNPDNFLWHLAVHILDRVIYGSLIHLVFAFAPIFMHPHLLRQPMQPNRAARRNDTRGQVKK
jgi:hypothetical protein